MVPLPVPLSVPNVVVPPANEPPGAESWAVNTLPAAKADDVVNGTVMASPAQNVAGTMALVAMVGFTVSATVLVTLQPPLLTTTW